MTGYLSPSLLPISGSHILNLEKVRMLLPRKKILHSRILAACVHCSGSVTPTSMFFNLRKLIFLSHHVDGCSLFLYVVVLILGQKTSCRGLASVHLLSMFDQMLPAPIDEAGSQVSPPSMRCVLPTPEKNRPKSNILYLTVAPKPYTSCGSIVPPMAVWSKSLISPSLFRSLYLMSPGLRLLSALYL